MVIDNQVPTASKVRIDERWGESHKRIEQLFIIPLEYSPVSCQRSSTCAPRMMRISETSGKMSAQSISFFRNRASRKVLVTVDEISNERVAIKRVGVAKWSDPKSPSAEDAIDGASKESTTSNNEKPGSRYYQLTDIAKRDNCQNSLFTIRQDALKHEFRVIKGLGRVNDDVMVEGNEERVIVVGMKEKELLQLSEVDLSDVKHNEIVDLSVEGDRWEGDALNDEACGWGVLYDEEGRMVYEGFRIGEVNACYGRAYYVDIGVIEYEGEWCDGVRWGRGVQYDRKGNAVYDGEWLNNERQCKKRVVMSDEHVVLHNRIEELVVSDGCCNGGEWENLDLSLITCLKSLRVGDDCFESAHVVTLIGLEQLRSVVIGANCFLGHGDSGSRFCVKDCPQLKILKMGFKAFYTYTACEIESADALEVIEMGDKCFQYVNELKLIGLSKLESVVIGENCFVDNDNRDPNCRFCLKNCSSLRELRIGCGSFTHYSVCEIENVDGLEIVRMGGTRCEHECSCFYRSSMELKSILILNE